MSRLARTSARTRGLTLVELMLAVSVTAFVGVAIAIVMTTAGRNLSRVGEVRSALQRSHAMHARLRAYTDASLCVLEEDPEQGFAVWLHDERPGNTINISELRVLWYDKATEELSVEWYVFPEGLTPAEEELLDVEVALGADYFLEMTVYRKAGRTARLVLADGVVSIGLSHDAVSFVDADRLRAAVDQRINDDETQPMLFSIGISNHTVPN